MHSKLSIFVLISLIVTSCSVSAQTDFPTATPLLVITATLPPSPILRSSDTPAPPPPTSTVTPVQGTTFTQLNVRTEPSTASYILGIIVANQIVQIVGQDPGGNWWQILYEAGADGKGWVTAQYVETAGRLEVPVIGGGEVNPNSGNSAVILQQLNIRSGPGTSFDSIGILKANDVVYPSGKNRDGAWLQIDFASGPNGKGWVSTAFVRIDALDALPVVSNLGDVVGTGTPMDTPLPPPPTIVPAPMDFDSADTPLKSILFDRVGIQTLIYNGDVSVPDGDAEDWIAFSPYAQFVLISIQCTGNGSLQVEIVGNGETFTCNETDALLRVQAGTSYLVHIEALPTQGLLQYINYILTIKASQ